ncbi:Uncharacterised protein g9322 [Pycnogonum litorale]
MSSVTIVICLIILCNIHRLLAQNSDCGPLKFNETCIEGTKVTEEEEQEEDGTVVTESVGIVTEWLEMDIVAGFRAWQVMFLCIAGLITLIMFFCCVTNGRIPRTKQQIDADYQRKKLAKKFRAQLNKIQCEEMDLAEAIQKLKEEMPDSFSTLDAKNLMKEQMAQNGDALSSSGAEDGDDEKTDDGDEKPASRPKLGQLLRKTLLGLRLTRKSAKPKDEETNEIKVETI